MTEQEKVILQSIDPIYKYITRDENGELYVFASEPRKGTSEWINEELQECTGLDAFNYLFKNVSWEDEEPILIEDLLSEAKEDILINKTMLYKLEYWQNLLQRDNINSKKIVREEIKKVLENYKEVK